MKIVSEAFFSTIESVLREDLTEKCKNVWIKIISVLELEVKNGMKKAESED